MTLRRQVNDLRNDYQLLKVCTDANLKQINNSIKRLIPAASYRRGAANFEETGDGGNGAGV